MSARHDDFCKRYGFLTNEEVCVWDDINTPPFTCSRDSGSYKDWDKKREKLVKKYPGFVGGPRPKRPESVRFDSTGAALAFVLLARSLGWGVSNPVSNGYQDVCHVWIGRKGKWAEEEF